MESKCWCFTCPWCDGNTHAMQVASKMNSSVPNVCDLLKVDCNWKPTYFMGEESFKDHLRNAHGMSK